MSQPVTTNPFIIMLINMTVVFLVLIALGVVINLIHYVDPTKPKAKKEEAPAPAPAPAPVVKAAPEPVKEEGLTPEVVAVIAAAVASLGYGPGAVKAIRPIERNGWKQSGRTMEIQRLIGRSFRSVIVCSAVISVICAAVGIILSILCSTPVGSTIVCADIVVFFGFSIAARLTGRTE